MHKVTVNILTLSLSATPAISSIIHLVLTNDNKTKPQSTFFNIKQEQQLKNEKKKQKNKWQPLKSTSG